MSKANPSFIVYIVGLLPLGFMLNWIEQQLNDSWWVVVIVIVYLLFLRFLGDYLSKLKESKVEESE
jgi:uncharacterized protein (DUF983 family)